MIRIPDFVRRLIEDERGTSLLEFAFVAPAFVMMTVGVADIGYGFSKRYALQQAVNRTLEMATLGSRKLDYTFLKDEAAAAAGVPVANVTLTQWLECNTTRKAFNDDCGTGEQIARYVTLTVNSSFTPSFGASGYPGAVNGVVPLTASASLRVQ
jgi:Flp pilus assembly protein TadG